MHCKTDVRLVAFLISLSLAFGASCRVSADDVMTPAVDIEKTLKLLGDEDAVVAGKAALDLGRSKNSSPAVIAALVKHLDDRREAIHESLLCATTPTVADYASRALQNIGGEAAVQPACQLLKCTKCKETKYLVLQLLGNLGPVAHQSMETLVACTKDKDWVVRYYAFESIGVVSSDPKEAVPLLRLALSDKEADVQSIAVRALGNFGFKAVDAVPDLVPLLDSVEQRIVVGLPDVGSFSPLKFDVTETLGKIGPPATVAIPKLTLMLNSKDPKVQIEAAAALCQITDECKLAFELLLNEIEKNANRDTYPGFAIEALGHIRHEKFAAPSFEAIKKALKSSDEYVRATAVEAIGEISPPDVVELVGPFVKDESIKVRASAIRVLSKHTEALPELQDVFIECLANRSDDRSHFEEDCMEAAIALGKMGSRAERAVPCLESCTGKHEGFLVKREAKKALDQILNNEKTIRRLLKQLDDKDPVVAGKAAKLLGCSGNSSKVVLQALIEHLDDERIVEKWAMPMRVDVRRYASEALMQIDQSEVAATLCEALAESKEKKLRIKILRTLRKLEKTASGSIDQLALCIQEEDTDIRLHALGAIIAVSDDPAKIVPLYRKVLRDKKANASLKSVAVCALGRLEAKAADAVPDLIPLLDSTEKLWYAISADIAAEKYLAAEVAETLWRIREPAKVAIPRLTVMLDNEHGELRVAAAAALCRIPGDREIGLNALIEELKKDRADGDPVGAIKEIGWYGSRFLGDQGIKAIRGALKHPDDEVRAITVWAVGRLKQPDVVQLLRPMADDASETVQANVIEILSEHSNSNPELLDLFIEKLTQKPKDEYDIPEASPAAALALGKIGVKAEKAIPILQKYASEDSDVDMLVQEAAQKALKMIQEAKKKAAKERSDGTKQ